MAHKRKDTLARPREYARHLRPEGKRIQAKAERRAAKAELQQETEKAKTAEIPARSRGVTKPRKHRKRWKIEARCLWRLSKKDWYTLGMYKTEARALTAARAQLQRFYEDGTIRLITPTGKSEISDANSIRAYHSRVLPTSI